MFNLILKTLKIKGEKAMSKKIIGFRVSEEERKLLEQLAAAENKELSDYIRERVFSSAVKYELKCDSEREIREIRDIKQTLNNKTEELKELLTKQLQEELNAVKSEIEKTQMRVKIAEKLIHQKCDVDLVKLSLLLQTIVIVFLVIYAIKHQI